MHSHQSSSSPDADGSSPELTPDELVLQQQRRERQQSYVSDLAAIVPQSSILTTDQQLLPYESDGLTAIKQKPLLVVLPETIVQVQATSTGCLGLASRKHDHCELE